MACQRNRRPLSLSERFGSMTQSNIVKENKVPKMSVRTGCEIVETCKEGLTENVDANCRINNKNLKENRLHHGGISPRKSLTVQVMIDSKYNNARIQKGAPSKDIKNNEQSGQSWGQKNERFVPVECFTHLENNNNKYTAKQDQLKKTCNNMLNNKNNETLIPEVSVKPFDQNRLSSTQLTDSRNYCHDALHLNHESIPYNNASSIHGLDNNSGQEKSNVVSSKDKINFNSGINNTVDSSGDNKRPIYEETNFETPFISNENFSQSEVDPRMTVHSVSAYGNPPNPRSAFQRSPRFENQNLGCRTQSYGNSAVSSKGHSSSPQYGKPQNRKQNSPKYGNPPSPRFENPTSSRFGNSQSPTYGSSCSPRYGNPQIPRYGNPTSPRYGNPPIPRYGNPPSPRYGNPPIPRYGNPPSPRYGKPPSSKYENQTSPRYGNPPSPGNGNLTSTRFGNSISPRYNHPFSPRCSNVTSPEYKNSQDPRSLTKSPKYGNSPNFVNSLNRSPGNGSPRCGQLPSSGYEYQSSPTHVTPSNFRDCGNVTPSNYCDGGNVNGFGYENDLKMDKFGTKRTDNIEILTPLNKIHPHGENSSSKDPISNISCTQKNCFSTKILPDGQENCYSYKRKNCYSGQDTVPVFSSSYSYPSQDMVSIYTSTCNFPYNINSNSEKNIRTPNIHTNVSTDMFDGNKINQRNNKNITSELLASDIILKDLPSPESELPSRVQRNSENYGDQKNQTRNGSSITIQKEQDQLVNTLLQQCQAMVENENDKQALKKVFSIIHHETKQQKNSLSTGNCKVEKNIQQTNQQQDCRGNGKSPVTPSKILQKLCSVEAKFSPPTVSPNGNTEKIVKFEGRTLLKGGVAPRHIPKNYTSKLNKEAPEDPRYSFPDYLKNHSINIPLPPWATNIFGIDKVRRLESSSKERNQNVPLPIWASEFCAENSVNSDYHEKPLPSLKQTTPKQDELGTPISDNIDIIAPVDMEIDDDHMAGQEMSADNHHGGIGPAEEKQKSEALAVECIEAMVKSARREVEKDQTNFSKPCNDWTLPKIKQEPGAPFTFKQSEHKPVQVVIGSAKRDGNIQHEKNKTMDKKNVYIKDESVKRQNIDKESLQLHKSRNEALLPYRDRVCSADLNKNKGLLKHYEVVSTKPVVKERERERSRSGNGSERFRIRSRSRERHMNRLSSKSDQKSYRYRDDNRFKRTDSRDRSHSPVVGKSRYRHHSNEDSDRSSRSDSYREDRYYKDFSPNKKRRLRRDVKTVGYGEEIIYIPDSDEEIVSDVKNSQPADNSEPPPVIMCEKKLHVDAHVGVFERPTSIEEIHKDGTGSQKLSVWERLY